jgi:hypothetical protein
MTQINASQALTKTDTIIGGVKLNRVYAPGENPETVCGKLSLWNQIVAEISSNSLEYYWPSGVGVGQNKFLKHVEVFCYAQSVTYPEASIGGQVTYALGNANSKITLPFTDPNQYWFKAALSHEFGHAYHNWVRMFEGGVYADVRRWWDHEITVNKVTFDPNVYPWKQANGSVQNDYEQFANSFRILFGTAGTRGASTTNGEIVPPGFKDTNQIAGLKKRLQILPELCAMVASYGGIVPNTLQYGGDGFMFQIPSGHWVWQNDYNVWSYNSKNILGQWVGWTQFYPSYTRD